MECLKWQGSTTNSLARNFFNAAGNLHPAQSAHVLGNAAVERFGDALAIFRRSQPVFVTRVTDEGNLRQNRGHVRPDEHNERRFPHTPIADARTLCRQSAVQSALHVRSKLARFFNLFFERDLLH